MSIASIVSKKARACLEWDGKACRITGKPMKCNGVTYYGCARHHRATRLVVDEDE
jgi:hypothetical protein